MRQMQLYEFYTVTKKSTSQFVNKQSQPVVEERNQKKTRKRSNISVNTSKKSSSRIVKPRVRKSKKMTDKPRYVQNVIVISDDEDDDVGVPLTNTQWTQDVSQCTPVTRLPSLTSQIFQKNPSSSTTLEEPTAETIAQSLEKRRKINEFILAEATRENSLDKHLHTVFPDAEESDENQSNNEEIIESLAASDELSTPPNKQINQNTFPQTSRENNLNIFNNNLQFETIAEENEEEEDYGELEGSTEYVLPTLFSQKRPFPIEEIFGSPSKKNDSFEDNLNPLEQIYHDENINEENKKLDKSVTEEGVEMKKMPSLRIKSVNSINELYTKSMQSSSYLMEKSNSQLSDYQASADENFDSTPIKGSQNLLWDRSQSSKRSREYPDEFLSPTKKSPSPWKMMSPQKSSPTLSQESLSCGRRRLSPRKIFPDKQDTSLISEAIENLNLFKQHVIMENNFDLHDIYSKNKKFTMQYGHLDTGTTTMYDFRDLNIPKPGCFLEKDAERLFMAIIDVFTNPINPGYFTEEETDIIYSILTLSVEAQVLLARMIKRKIKWTRKRDLNKEEINGSIDAHLRELIGCKLLDTQFDKSKTDAILDLLSRDEVSQVCKMMKVPHKTSKATMIEMLLKLAAKKPLFRGMKTPRQALQEAIDTINGECVKVADITMKLVGMILTLLYPTQDPEKNISDAFYLLHEVYFTESKIFPKTPKIRYPIFSNRKHLIDYIEAKNLWTEYLNLTQQKNKDDEVWENVRKIGRIAYEKLIIILNSDSEDFQTRNDLPSHVKRFMPVYVWGKILSGSVEAFKKLTVEQSNEAIEILEFLIANRAKIQGKFIKWYIELSQLVMNRLKNLEKSAEIIMEALAIPNISDADKTGLIERARILSARAKNISFETKNLMKQQVELHSNSFVFRPKEVTISAIMMQGFTGNKSTWQLAIGGVDKGYTNVERVAIQHYIKNNNFSNGIHREGSLAVTLFTCFFWEEIYHVFVPGAFVCPFQVAPLDIFGSKFIANRDGKIERKLKEYLALSEEEFSNKMVNCYTTYRDYECLITNIVDSAEEFQEIVECLGKKGVIAICCKLASDMNVWKAGFPDLFLWNSKNKTCKVVEVKGPGDTLSVKQKLWIDYLEKNQVPVEVCHVQAAARY